ncbi:serine/threonine-protein phosphatase 2A 56 kDa regulatory subunit epsilon isoform-like [Drosophila ficusphila]|uniref:serine/threonine-protein phosphatase 2A 56 kDa regulatory subunit epsilon isoform-like n=1 Tax=Drosophila ficusphila TaxID=30025 RepID=UPI0007E7CEBF|nr:serine/threonine-protein phosphatase 2A 56 kDa regulatory subunit epsilon isoform-like [Drosophila ficusphila]
MDSSDISTCNFQHFEQRQSMYENYLEFLQGPEPEEKKERGLIKQHIVPKILAQLDTELDEEREYLKAILCCAYRRCTKLRSYIQSKINNVFFCCIYETKQVYGIPELLQVFAKIIDFYEMPLKAEKEQLLVDILLPLHKHDKLDFFHDDLVYCITKYLKRNNLLAGPLIIGLLRFWPKRCTKKEILFLEELEAILWMSDTLQLDVIHEALFRQIAKCMSSISYRVAEKALHLWANPVILKLMETNYKIIMPIAFPALYVNSHNHWVNSSLSIFLRIDEHLFKELAYNYEAEREKALEFEREKRWRKVYELQSTSRELKFEFKFDRLQLDVIQELLFCQIVKCMSRKSSQVPKKALHLFSNPVILKLVEANYKIITPFAFPALYVISHNYWVALRFSKFLRIDENIFKELVQAELKKKRELKLEEWRKIYELGCNNKVLRSESPELQYTSTYKVGEPKCILRQVFRPYAGNVRHVAQMKKTVKKLLLNV